MAPVVDFKSLRNSGHVINGERLLLHKSINLKLLVVFTKRQNLPYSEATNGLESVEEYKAF